MSFFFFYAYHIFLVTVLFQFLVTYLCLGGGVALLYASKELDNLQTANFDQKIGVQIIQNALKVYILP